MGGAIYGAKTATAVKQSMSEKPMMADGFLKIRRRVNLSSRMRGWGWGIVMCKCNKFNLLFILLEHPGSVVKLKIEVYLQSVQPYPRIDKGVKNIEGQIDEHVNQPEKETNAH